MKKVCLLNLGCKVNQYEIDGILCQLKGEYETSTKMCVADIYIVNTCAVTQEAEKKSRQIVSKISKLNPNAEIYVCGCASQNNPEQFLSKPQVVSVIGNKGKGEIKDNFGKHGNFVCAVPKEYEDDLISTNTRTRGYVKIQDGCNNYCSYCLIPYVRGFSRSRSLDSIYKEAKLLSGACKEIVLTGINISDYRIDNKLALGQVLDRLKDLPSRIRLGSIEVNVIDEDFLKIASSMPNFCPQFHLSLQSGSDAVLKHMNRHYTAKEYLDKVELIRKYFPNPGITTDVIVGYPTETEENFQETLDFVKAVRFSDIHFFPYSSRQGTRAGKLPQINGLIVKERENRLRKVVYELRNKYLFSCLKQELEVLIEEKVEDFYTGFARNYVRVYVKGEYQEGDLLLVKPIDVMRDGILCEFEKKL